MRTKEEIITNLKRHQSVTPSKWREEGECGVAHRQQGMAPLFTAHSDDDA